MDRTVMAGQARDRWVLERRGARNPVDPSRPYAALRETEAAADGALVDTCTLFLTNKECPWRCLMCDLWRNTLETSVAGGVIPSQIDQGLSMLGYPSDFPGRAQVKLYNSGSFFDTAAIPSVDYPAIARRVLGFERVIVECHPKLVGERVARFLAELAVAAARAGRPVPRLEVAMGLETAHPDALERLNKRMSVDDFRDAAGILRGLGVALRVFLLVHPPFVPRAEARDWLVRSLTEAFDAGAGVVSLIPLRLGNGALDSVAAEGEAWEPPLSELEHALETGLALGRGRVFGDLWDLARFSGCPDCLPARSERLARMNERQATLPPVDCPCCRQARPEATR